MIGNLTYISILMLLPSIALSGGIKDKTYGSVTVDEVTSIYDGDTFRANIKGWPDVIGYRMSIRVNGIDTPELRGKCQAEKDLARLAKQTTVESLRTAKLIELKNIKRGKFFRLIADVYVDGKSLAERLIKNKQAIVYNGRTKINWCE